MKAYEFHFTITGINRRQAAMIMRTVIRLIEALQSKPTAIEIIDLAGGFEEITISINPEQEGASNVQ